MSTIDLLRCVIAVFGARTRVSMVTAVLALGIEGVGEAVAQTASPMTPPPRFPQAAPFNPQTAPASGRAQASMVRIPGGTYTIGSPPQHPLANRAAMPQQRVSIMPFRIDRTEVTNEQFAEFLNALPVKPIRP